MGYTRFARTPARSRGERHLSGVPWSRVRSAGFQSAVSAHCIRQDVGSSHASASASSSRSAILRYSRVQLCATTRRSRNQRSADRQVRASLSPGLEHADSAVRAPGKSSPTATMLRDSTAKVYFFDSHRSRTPDLSSLKKDFFFVTTLTVTSCHPVPSDGQGIIRWDLNQGGAYCDCALPPCACPRLLLSFPPTGFHRSAQRLRRSAALRAALGKPPQ